MIYALISGHPAGVDPGECAGICAMMFTNLPPPKNCISLSKSCHFPSNLTQQLVQMKRYVTK